MREIQLTKGKVALVDDELFDALVAMGKWCVSKFGYAVRNKCVNGQRSTIYMHRKILELAGLPLGKATDHKDGEKLNNQLSNLRSATIRQNSFNRGCQSNNTSGFKGVIWFERTSKWRSQIRISGVTKHLGYFRDKTEAALAYDQAAIKLFGEFACLNFAIAA